MGGVRDQQTYEIPEYNLTSLVRSVTQIVNLARRGLLSDSDAIDEIVLAYQVHSL